jgi:2-amino-4-hydroxy-6-hydroxymethyldihydropteridine diphosphokinase
MILIALGANMPGPAGSPAAALTAALKRLAERGIKILCVSSFYESPA